MGYGRFRRKSSRDEANPCPRRGARGGPVPRSTYYRSPSTHADSAPEFRSSDPVNSSLPRGVGRRVRPRTVADEHSGQGTRHLPSACSRAPVAAPEQHRQGHGPDPPEQHQRPGAARGRAQRRPRPGGRGSPWTPRRAAPASSWHGGETPARHARRGWGGGASGVAGRLVLPGRGDVSPSGPPPAPESPVPPARRGRRGTSGPRRPSRRSPGPAAPSRSGARCPA